MGEDVRAKKQNAETNVFVIVVVSAPVLEKADVQKAIWSYAKLVFGYGPIPAQPN